MVADEQFQKPKTVLYAEYSLWAWTAWACLFGIAQSWLQIPDIEKMMTEQLQGMFTITPGEMKEMIIGGYGVIAATSVWIVLKIGAGKNWARSSLLWGFVLEFGWTLCPPYHGILEYLTDLPDLVLQGCALYWLYARPGSGWFHTPTVK